MIGYSCFLNKLKGLSVVRVCALVSIPACTFPSALLLPRSVDVSVFVGLLRSFLSRMLAIIAASFPYTAQRRVFFTGPRLFDGLIVPLALAYHTYDSVILESQRTEHPTRAWQCRSTHGARHPSEKRYGPVGVCFINLRFPSRIN